MNAGTSFLNDYLSILFRRTALVTLGMVTVAIGGCGEGRRETTPEGEIASNSNTQPEASSIFKGQFINRGTQFGESLADVAWPDGTYALPEIMGGGVAVADIDGDGDLDIIQACCPPPNYPDAAAPNRVYRQESDGRFIEVGHEVGLDDAGYGQGVAIGDIDNDGDLDVYFTNFGKDSLYRNEGNGTFELATESADIDEPGWNTSAVFADYDADGDLDLYVVQYTEFNPDTRCAVNSSRDYCGPMNFPATTDSLYQNRGNGRFTKVGLECGITTSGKGLGVLCHDFTGDGLADFYVANDGEANQLWVQDGSGKFSDESILRGVSVNAAGKPEGSMGIALGDVDGDGQADLFMTHIAQETNTLYMGDSMHLYSDQSSGSGLGIVDLNYTGFGCAFLDYDNDGDLDLAVACGKVKGEMPIKQDSDVIPFWSRYAETNLLFSNDGRGRFHQAMDHAGHFGMDVRVSRGLAIGDLDDDGNVDLVIGNIGGPPQIYLNEVDSPNHWLSIRAIEQDRDALGARVEIKAGDRYWLRFVLPGISYASSSDPRCHVGLGDQSTVDHIDITWADGIRERFPVDAVDRTISIIRGSGTIVSQ